MPTLRPMDPIAIEKQLESSDAPVVLISVSTIDDGLLPGEKLHQDEALARLHRQERSTKLPSDTPSNRSDVRVRSFVLAFVGMLCATFIGFVSEIRPLDPNSPDRVYDEAPGTQTSSLSSADFPMNSSDDGAAIVRGEKGGPDGRRVRATVGCVDALSTANLHAKTIGGDHVD